MAYGPVLGAGSLAVIIPPSALAVLLGSLAQIDVGALLIAGVVPGLVLTLMFVALISSQARRSTRRRAAVRAPSATGCARSWWRC